MRRVSAKFIPKLLSGEQKQHRLQVAQELINRSENDADLLNSVITGDESWVYGYDPETKDQSSQWKSPGSPRPKKTRQSRSNVKTMMVVFFDSTGIVHQSTRNTIKVSLSVYAKTWGRKGLHSGETGIGSSTMTTRRHIMHSPSLNFWTNSKFLCLHNPHIPLILPCRFLPVSKIKIFSERTLIWQYWRHPGKYGEGS